MADVIMVRQLPCRDVLMRQLADRTMTRHAVTHCWLQGQRAIWTAL